MNISKISSCINVSNFNLFLFNICEIIVGITALKDCLGPNVLKGLIIFIGELNDKL